MVLLDPYAWMRRRNRRYGDVFSGRFPFFGQVVYVVDPVEVKRLFAGDPARFHAGEANALMVGEPLGARSRAGRFSARLRCARACCGSRST